jgi:uncharacterized repeat protein (TIGR01451 family)
MQKNRLFLIMALFTGLLLLAGSAGASNLTLSKTVDGDSPYQSGENITFVVVVTNYNETAETGVNVTEQVPPGCVIEEYLPHNGTVKDDVWTIDLEPGANDTLKFNMSCTLACGSLMFENIANISSPEPNLDNNPADNNAAAWITIIAPDCLSSNLTLKKSVVDGEEYQQGEPITWLLELTNNNLTESRPVHVTEQIPPGCILQNYQVSEGTFDDGIWSLIIGAGSDETLQINVSCNQVCGSQLIRNIANITSPAPWVDENPTDNNATSSVTVIGPACVNTTVRPVTLNLKSKGVLTVFFTVGGQLTAVEEQDEEEDDSVSAVQVDQDTSTLTCNGVDASKILLSMKDGGTVMGKFQRQALALEANDGTASLDCEGTIYLTDGRTISVQAINTINVIHAEATQKQSLIQRILAFFGLAGGSSDQSGNTEPSVTTPINTNEVKNLNQLKKMLRTGTLENESEQTATITVPTTTPGKGKPEDKGNGNGKKDTALDQSKGKAKGNS